LEVANDAKEFLAEKGYDKKFGARPLRRAIERYIEDPLAEEILSGNIKAGEPIQVKANTDKLSFKQKKKKAEKVK